MCLCLCCLCCTVFETIPQAVLQFLLLSNVFGRGNSNVTPSDVYLSIATATLNCIFQLLRLRLESEACEEKFTQYCLECLMARISWIPFEKQVLRFLNGNTTTATIATSTTAGDTIVNISEVAVIGGSNKRDMILSTTTNKISYDIRYNYPCGITKMVGYEPKLEFDFSSITIQKLISTIKLSKTRSPRTPLEINFGKSLRLINFQDLMNLFETCLEKDIKIVGFDNSSIAHLLTNAMNISANASKDVRLLSNCRNSFGKPFVSNLFCLSKIFGTSSRAHTRVKAMKKEEESLLSTMFECLISNDFDVNVNNKRNGETIIFDLIGENKYSQFLLLLQKFVKQKQCRLMLNYYNYSGISPLYFAIKKHIQDKKLQQQIENTEEKNNDEFKLDESEDEKTDNAKEENVRPMYEILIENECETASVNFPAFESNGVVRSCLASAVLVKEWDIVNKLLKKGGVLNVTEIPILIEVYLDLVYDRNNGSDNDNAFESLKQLLNKCNICNKHLIDKHGNNPIHKVFENIGWQGLDAGGDDNGANMNQHVNSISKLLSICSNWMFMENNDEKIPVEYLFNLMFPQRNGTQIIVDYQYVQLCNELMNVIKEKFESLHTKLTTQRIKEYPFCVSYLRLLPLFGSASQTEKERDTYVSLITHFENIIFDESIKGVIIASDIQDLDTGVETEHVSSMFDKFIETNFSEEKKLSFDDLIKCLVPSKDDDVSSEVNDDVKVDSGDGDDAPPPEVEPQAVEEEASANELGDLEIMEIIDDNKNEENEDADDNELEFEDEQQDVDDGEDDKKEEKETIVQQQQEEEIEEKKPLSWIELVYILCVESLSCADLITDFVILSQLIEEHVWWSTFSVIFMISPYLVSYTAMGSMLQKKSHKLSLIVMTPLCLIYFMILDVVFMFYALFSSLIFLFSFGTIDIGDWMEIHFFIRILHVSRMELYGYRRLRTLAQLLFETFPSLILQLRILSVIGIDKKLGVSPEALIFSILFALLHMFMEGMIIKLDSSACHLSMYQYCIVCINARLSWIPYANILTMKSIGKNNNGIGISVHNNNNKNSKINKLSQFTSLNFEEIISKFLCLNYKLDFEFGKDSWQILIKYINNIVEFAPNISNSSNNNNNSANSNANRRDGNVELELIGVKELLAPILTDTIDDGQLTRQERSILMKQNETFAGIPSIMKLTFGEQCCKNIDLYDLLRLYQVASNKVILDCQTIDWQRIIRRTINLHSETQVINVLDDLNDVFLSVGDYSSAIKLGKHRREMGYFDNSDNSDNSVGSVVSNDNNDNNGASFGLLNERLRANNSFLSLKERLLSNVKFNIFPLKKCYKNGIMYGMNCNESKKLYLNVYQLLQSPLQSVNSIVAMTATSYGNDTYTTTRTNRNYITLFENGQSFYTAMLVLFFSQGTIFERNHHCYQCGRDWIDHLQQFDKKFQNNFSNNNNNRNNNNNNNNDNQSSLSVRDKMGQLFSAYIPQEIEIKQQDSNDIYTSVSIETINVCSPLKKAFGEYLFKRAYFYSLAIGAINGGVNTHILENLLKQLNENKSFKIKCNNNNNNNNNNNVDETIEQLDLLTQFGNNYSKNPSGVLDDGFMNEISATPKTVELMYFDKQTKQQSINLNNMSFYGGFENIENVFIGKIDVGVTFDMSFMFSDFVLPENIWDNINGDVIVCKVECYLYCQNATKIPLDKRIDINANDVKTGNKISLSWNVNHIYNILNNINIGTANIEIKFLFADSFIRDFNDNDHSFNFIGINRKIVDSIECQAVYQDIATFDI